MTTLYDDIYSYVCSIQRGKVKTYGDVAKAIGKPSCARVVGYALHKNPLQGKIPCHRVVFRDGSLAKGFVFGGPDKQRKLLETEGVTFIKGGKVDMKKHKNTYQET